MGASNSNQKSSTPDPDQQTSLENQESQPSASTRRQLPPCPPVPCSCTKGGCAAACDPRETRAIPTNCCGSCEGSAACGPCQVISSNIDEWKVAATSLILDPLSHMLSPFSHPFHSLVLAAAHQFIPVVRCLILFQPKHQCADLL